MDEIVRDPHASHEVMKRLVLMSRISRNISAELANTMLALLDQDEQEGHEQPPGFVALEEWARRENAR